MSNTKDEKLPTAGDLGIPQINDRDMEAAGIADQVVIARGILQFGAKRSASELIWLQKSCGEMRVFSAGSGLTVTGTGLHMHRLDYAMRASCDKVTLDLGTAGVWHCTLGDTNLVLSSLGDKDGVCVTWLVAKPLPQLDYLGLVAEKDDELREIVKQKAQLPTPLAPIAAAGIAVRLECRTQLDEPSSKTRMYQFDPRDWFREHQYKSFCMAFKWRQTLENRLMETIKSLVLEWIEALQTQCSRTLIKQTIYSTEWSRCVQSLLLQRDDLEGVSWILGFDPSIVDALDNLDEQCWELTCAISDENGFINDIPPPMKEAIGNNKQLLLVGDMCIGEWWLFASTAWI